MIALFLENKSPLDATDSAGYTALHHAIAEGQGTSSAEGVDDLPPLLTLSAQEMPPSHS